MIDVSWVVVSITISKEVGNSIPTQKDKKYDWIKNTSCFINKVKIIKQYIFNINYY